MIIGICGGFQILGKELKMMKGIGDIQKLQKRLGILDITTVFADGKTLDTI